MREAYCHATVVTPEGVLEDANIVIEDGVFTEVAIGGTEGVDLGGAYVLPGFIDSHIHGFGPFDFDDPNCDFDAAVAALRREGTTAFLPTVCPTPGRTYRRLQSAATPGYHLEGPFINPARKGGFDDEQILPYDGALAQSFFAAFHGQARIMTAAPEMIPISELCALADTWGVRLSAGHTQANVPTAQAAFAGGFRAVTHFFNAMAGHHHRAPGVWDEAMWNDDVTLEIIADLHHVCAESVKLLLRAKGADRLIAITDCVYFRGAPYEVRGGLIYRDGVICGSQSVMRQLFCNLVLVLGVPLPQAVRMTSTNIARALNLPLGDIRKGYRADFVVINGEFKLRAVHTGGTWETIE